MEARVESGEIPKGAQVNLADGEGKKEQGLVILTWPDEPAPAAPAAPKKAPRKRK
jgi:hypothetical protein